MFNNSVNIPGSNHTFNHAEGNSNINIYQGSRGLRGFERLSEHVATGALHNSGEVSDAPKCHPGTRVAILDRVFTWAAATFYLICIQWIYGPAGAGKSAILRTLAGMLAEHGLLLASFFFFRTAAGRNSTDLFIPTIAYQIACSIPSTRRHIEQAIDHDPLIFSRSLEAQAQALIIDPITRAHKEGSIESQYPRIIIVDGLDECRDEEKQREVLRVLNNILLRLPIPFAVLIASRPEPHIRDTFNSDLNNTSTRLVLDDSYKPDNDIRKYLDDKFQEIRHRHPLCSLLPKDWPPPTVITTLVKKASGQFILPTTIIRFVEPHRHNPSQRLDMVLGSTSPGKLRPFEALDNLYSTIFASVEQDNLDAILAILGVLLVSLASPLVDVHELSLLTSITGYDEIDIRRVLFDLESLLYIADIAESSTSCVRVHHASLADFLFDQHRSGRFFISSPMVFERVARKCMETLLFSDDPWSLDFIGNGFQYSLHRAKPTDKLIQTLNDLPTRLSQLKGKKSVGGVLDHICDNVLPAIYLSALRDAETLHAHLLATVQQVIVTEVDSYFVAKTPLLLEHLIGTTPGHIHCFHYPHAMLLEIFPIRELGERCSVGFCLSRFDLGSAIDLTLPKDLFAILVLNAIRNRAGDYFADFTIHALRWISKYPGVLAEPGRDDVRIFAQRLLPELLVQSRPRSDLAQLITDDSLHPAMLEKIPKYAVAVEDYLSRVGSTSTHDNIPSKPTHSIDKTQQSLGLSAGSSVHYLPRDEIPGDTTPLRRIGGVTTGVPNNEMVSSPPNRDGQQSRRREPKEKSRWRPYG